LSKSLFMILSSLIANFVSADCVYERLLYSESDHSDSIAIVFNKKCEGKVAPYLYVAIVKDKQILSAEIEPVAILDSPKNSILLDWDKRNSAEVLTIQKDKGQKFSKKLMSYKGIKIDYVH
jgi:hypothetical protein